MKGKFAWGFRGSGEGTAEGLFIIKELISLKQSREIAMTIGKGMPH